MRYLSTTPRVHLALVTTQGGTFYPYPLLELTALLVRVWSLWLVGVTLLDLLSASIQLVGIYSNLWISLLSVLLLALLWGVTPRWVYRGTVGGGIPR